MSRVYTHIEVSDEPNTQSVRPICDPDRPWTYHNLNNGYVRYHTSSPVFNKKLDTLKEYDPEAYYIFKLGL